MKFLLFKKENKSQNIEKTEYLPIYRRDLLPTTNTNRRLVFAPPGTGKNIFYLNPIAAAYVGRVVLVTSELNWRGKSATLGHFLHYKPNELETLETFEKIIVVMDTLSADDMYEQHLEKVLSFVNKQSEKALIIIDEAMAVLGKNLNGFISSAPQNCIVFLESLYQMPDIFIEKKEQSLEMLQTGKWNIISLETIYCAPEWDIVKNKILDVMDIPCQRFRMN